MSKTEDSIPTEYPYAWSKDSTLTLPDFLAKYKPSMVQNDGTKPWLWVRGSQPVISDTGNVDAIKEASVLLKDVTERVEAIKNDASIPTRSNKKTGAKSKKELREQIQAEAAEKLKKISQKHGYICGKWLIFASSEKVDRIWFNLATSLVSGPLASTAAYLAKVATSPEDESSGSQQRLICVYLPNVYDKAAVTEVMRILLRNHGLSLSGVKSDMYTELRIDSKHASGIQSTIWKNSDLMKESEIKELREAFFAEVESNKGIAAPKAESSDKPPAAATAKLQLKKKANDDPFASDNEEEMEEAQRKQEIKAKTASGKRTKRPKDNQDEDEENDEEEERPKKKRAGKK